MQETIEQTKEKKFELGKEEVPVIFEKSKEGTSSVYVSKPSLDQPLTNFFPENFLRKNLNFPEVNEVEVIRHYFKLSKRNFGIDNGFYPLGSCTMKFNPKINEDIARLPGFAFTNPLQPESMSQGNLELLYNLERYLSEITGMSKFTLQPAAGAHGELTGLMLIQAYHKFKGENRTKILVPDSSHGTNPAAATFCGYETIELKSNSSGGIDLNTLRDAMNDDVAGIMLTNPNTLGLFEDKILEVNDIVHSCEGLSYCDGANMNAILGIAKPAEMGFDVMHLNLHKTFSTPHGGGGPGAGPVGVTEKLKPFLPKPEVVKNGGKYELNYNLPQSIGQVRSQFGNFGILVRAYTYIRALGNTGLRQAGENAVLNANYILRKLQGYYPAPYPRDCKHECVLTGEPLVEKFGVHVTDVAKRLLDYGMHAPTIYFPLIVKEALMIEPTESESKETLDEFIQVMIKIYKEAESNPQLVKHAPYTTPVSRLDGVKAARQPDIRWQKS